MKEDRIWILLSRQLAGEILPGEQAELNILLDKLPAEDKEAYRLLAKGSLSGADEEEAIEATGIYWEKHREFIETLSVKPSPPAFRKRTWLKWAAAACLTALISFIVWENIPPASLHAPVQEAVYAKIVTGPKEKKNLVLPDGSRVTLNENSSFRYNKNMGLKHSRSASLSGEAYFEIVSNPGAPFVIQTPQMDIKVLGTSFNVQANEKDSVSETTLFHGKIEVTLAGEEKNKRIVLLQPEEKLTVKNSRFRVTRLREQPDTTWSQTVQYTISEIAKPAGENIYKENAWASGKVVFNDDPFSSVAAFLEKKYGISIRFNDPGMRETRLRGVFQDDSLLSILEALKFTSGFHYTITDSVVTIY